MRRRSLLILVLALPARGQERDEPALARDIAEAHERGDRGRLLLLAAEPAARVNYARVVDLLLRGGRAGAAEALAKERQGPEAEGLLRLLRSFQDGLFPTADDDAALRQWAARIDDAPEAALKGLDAIRAREGTLFAADLSWVRAKTLLALDRKEDARTELERCSARARAVGDWTRARDADEARLRLSATGHDALPAAEAFLDAAKRLDDRAATIRALRARAKVKAVLGELLRREGKLDDARLRWKEAREDHLAAADLAEKEGDRRTIGLCWRDIAVILQEREGQPGEALRAYERALGPLRAAGTPEEIDGTLLNVALARTALAQYAEALAVLDEILAPGRGQGIRAMALEQRAYLLGRTGRLRSAAAAYAEALEAAPPAARARLLVGAGDLHLARLDPRAALRFHEEALALAPGEPSALAGRARALSLLGDDEAAEAAFEASLARLEGDGDRTRRAIVLAFLAEHLRDAGRIDDALRVAADELRIFADEKLREYVNAGAAWKTLADLTMLRNDHEKGAEHLARASTIFFSLNQPRLAIEAYAREMLLLVMLQRTRPATERLQVLEHMARTTPDDALKSVAASAAAIFEARGGRGARALELLDEARRLAQSAGDRTREATALVNRALLEPEAAADRVREALRLLDADRLHGPVVRPLIEGETPDRGPAIALDGILRSEQERPGDALAFAERALADRLLLALRGRDVVLLAGLAPEQHALYVAARADLVEARATGTGVAEAEAAFDAMVGKLRAEAPSVADLAWPPEPPLAGVQQALRANEALVMAVFDPYVKCALYVDGGRAVLRRVEGPGSLLDDFKDLLGEKDTVIFASAGPVEAFPAAARVRVCHVPTASVFLRQRTGKRARGEGLASLGGSAPPRFPGAPDPAGASAGRRVSMLYVDGIDLAPHRLLARTFDADTVVLVSPGGALWAAASAVLARGAGNVVVAGRPPGPLDTFLAGCLDRKLPVGAAFREASAKGPLFFHGAPE